MLNAIIHPCPHVNGGVAKSPLKLAIDSIVNEATLKSSGNWLTYIHYGLAI